MPLLENWSETGQAEACPFRPKSLRDLARAKKGEKKTPPKRG
jgi:hypothetical protein